MTDEGKNNILEVSKTYSKNKGVKKSEWEEDSEKKEKRAGKDIVDASEFFMTKSYKELQSFTSNSQLEVVCIALRIKNKLLNLVQDNHQHELSSIYINSKECTVYDTFINGKVYWS